MNSLAQPTNELILLRLLEPLAKELLNQVPEGHGVNKLAVQTLLEQLEHVRLGDSSYPERIYMRLYKTMEQRRLIGLQVHGHKVTDDPSNAMQWLHEAIAEAVDHLVYLEAAVTRLEEDHAEATTTAEAHRG